MLDFVWRLKLRQNWLVFRKTRKVYEQNISQRHEKCQFYAFGDCATGPDKAKYYMAPDATR